MKRTILACTCACLSACAIEASSDVSEGESELAVFSPDDDTVAAASSGGSVMIDLKSTAGIEQIQEAARALAAACHGTTTCPGVPISDDIFVIDCGSAFCSSQGCGPCDPESGCDRTVRKQPREQYQAYTSNGQVCLKYRPFPARNLSCSCSF